jgi:hypothetical protein
MDRGILSIILFFMNGFSDSTLEETRIQFQKSPKLKGKALIVTRNNHCLGIGEKSLMGLSIDRFVDEVGRPNRTVNC